MLYYCTTGSNRLIFLILRYWCLYRKCVEL